jgi:hypothetical protein
MRKRSTAKTCLRAGGAQLNRRAVIARARIPRPQEQCVGRPRNCLRSQVRRVSGCDRGCVKTRDERCVGELADDLDTKTLAKSHLRG